MAAGHRLSLGHFLDTSSATVLAAASNSFAYHALKIALVLVRLRSRCLIHRKRDPKRIAYGSKVVFPDRACTAVDTGPAVVSRKAARLCG
jgi:hypothetical protein